GDRPGGIGVDQRRGDPLRLSAQAGGVQPAWLAHPAHRQRADSHRLRNGRGVASFRGGATHPPPQRKQPARASRSRASRTGLGGSTDQKGSGTTCRTSKLASTITCRVVDITPAGKLVLSGERSVKVNSDTHTIKFHGIARPDDVAPDNTIASGSVADAQIEV